MDGVYVGAISMLQSAFTKWTVPWLRNGYTPALTHKKLLVSSNWCRCHRLDLYWTSAKLQLHGWQKEGESRTMRTTASFVLFCAFAFAFGKWPDLSFFCFLPFSLDNATRNSFMDDWLCAACGLWRYLFSQEDSRWNFQEFSRTHLSVDQPKFNKQMPHEQSQTCVLQTGCQNFGRATAPQCCWRASHLLIGFMVVSKLHCGAENFPLQRAESIQRRAFSAEGREATSDSKCDEKQINQFRETPNIWSFTLKFPMSWTYFCENGVLNMSHKHSQQNDHCCACSACHWWRSAFGARLQHVTFLLDKLQTVATDCFGQAGGQIWQFRQTRLERTCSCCFSSTCLGFSSDKSQKCVQDTAEFLVRLRPFQCQWKGGEMNPIRGDPRNALVWAQGRLRLNMNDRPGNMLLVPLVLLHPKPWLSRQSCSAEMTPWSSEVGRKVPLEAQSVESVIRENVHQPRRCEHLEHEEMFEPEK